MMIGAAAANRAGGAVRAAPCRPFVLGLAGRAGAGKSTIALALAAMVPAAEILTTAAPLKAMLRALYCAAGADAAEIARRLEGDLRGQPCPVLHGRAPREALQSLGMEWGRARISPDLWAGLWRARAARALAEGRSVINDSVRFDNEAALIRAMGGVVVGLTGRRAAGVPDHASEAGIAADFSIPNDAPPAEMARRVLAIIRHEGGAA